MLTLTSLIITNRRCSGRFKQTCPNRRAGSHSLHWQSDCAFVWPFQSYVEGTPNSHQPKRNKQGLISIYIAWPNTLLNASPFLQTKQHQACPRLPDPASNSPQTREPSLDLISKLMKCLLLLDPLPRSSSRANRRREVYFSRGPT